MNDKKRGLKSNPLFDKTESAEERTDSPQAEEASERGKSEAGPSEARAESEPATPQTDSSGGQSSEQPTDQEDERPTSSSVDQPVDRQTDQSTDGSIDLPIDLSTRQVMPRPMAFYLYEEQGEELDQLVRRLKKKYKLKTDRSALMRAILTEPVMDYHDETNDRRLVERLIRQEADRMIER